MEASAFSSFRLEESVHQHEEIVLEGHFETSRIKMNVVNSILEEANISEHKVPENVPENVQKFKSVSFMGSSAKKNPAQNKGLMYLGVNMLKKFLKKNVASSKDIDEIDAHVKKFQEKLNQKIIT